MARYYRTPSMAFSGNTPNTPEICMQKTGLMENTAHFKPPLKWAGGKRWLVPRLLELWATHHHRRLVEPFVGGMSVALGLQPHRALLNDANPHLINFYTWIKRGLSVSIKMENDSNCYYHHRQRFNDLIKSGEANSSEAEFLVTVTALRLAK